MDNIAKIEIELKDNSNVYMEGGKYLGPEKIKGLLLKNPFISNPEDRRMLRIKSNLVDFFNRLSFNKQKGIVDFLLAQTLITQEDADSFVQTQRPDPNWQSEVPGKSIANNLGIRVIKKTDIEKALKNITG